MSEEVVTWSVGAVGVTKVLENVEPLPTKVLLPEVTDELYRASRSWLEPYFAPPLEGELRLLLSLHSFIVTSAGRTIVVDTCVGPDPDRGLTGDPGFDRRLSAALGPDGLAAVDVVVCTHAHFDHVGWNTIEVDGRRVPTFPNARYLMTGAELDEVLADDHMAVAEPSIRPLLEASVLDVVDPDHAITDEVRLIPTPGHTAGHVSVAIESDGRRGLITGDAFHSPIQFRHPEVAATRFDTDSDRSTATRRRLVDDLGGTDAVVFGTHFATPSAGRVRVAADGVPWFEGCPGAVVERIPTAVAAMPRPAGRDREAG